MRQSKRIRLATVIPFVLGIFFGTMITSFLVLAVQSIDEELPLQKDAVDNKLAEPQREPPDKFLEEVQIEAQAETFSPSQLASYNVLTSRTALKERSFAIHQTWGGEKAIRGSVNYYVHPGAGKEEMDFANSRKMPVISLKTNEMGSIMDNGGSFKLWKSICTQKLEHFLWFVKIRDDVYLRRTSLVKLLSSLNSSEALLVGHFILPRGKMREDLGLREGESYCHEACYALSQKALRLFCPKLDSCQENARSINEDVEVARCMRTHFGVNCTAAAEVTV